MPANPAYSELKRFLADPARPPKTLGYHQLQGFLYTVTSAPQLITPSEWLPVVFDDDVGLQDLAEAQSVMEAMMALYNDINTGVAAEAAALPADCRFRDDVLANLDPAAPISQWSQGFVLGHDWLTDTWNACLPDEADETVEEFGTIVMTLGFFSSRRVAKAFYKEMRWKQPLPAMAATMRDVFPDAVREYARLGRLISQILSEDDQQDTPSPTSMLTVGRNDPCPCGSGRKFKKCCGSAS